MARPTLDRNVKFKSLIRRLCLPKPYVRGLLETFWDVANECGNPVIGTAEEVEAAAEWPGTPGQLFAALRDCHFIDRVSHNTTSAMSGMSRDMSRDKEPIAEVVLWEIHDYWDHAPEYVKGRMRKELERIRRRGGWTMSRDSHGTVTETADTPSPSPSKEEESSLESSSCPETPRPASSRPKGVGETVIFVYPTDGRAKEWALIV